MRHTTTAHLSIISRLMRKDTRRGGGLTQQGSSRSRVRAPSPKGSLRLGWHQARAGMVRARFEPCPLRGKRRCDRSLRLNAARTLRTVCRMARCRGVCRPDAPNERTPKQPRGNRAHRRNQSRRGIARGERVRENQSRGTARVEDVRESVRVREMTEARRASTKHGVPQRDEDQ